MALRLGNGIIVNTTSGTGDPISGFLLPLGDPNTGDGDGSLDDGVLPFLEDTSVSSAIDQINEFLLKLVPAVPTVFPNGTLVGSNYVEGTSPLLCDGVITDNTNGGTLPSVASGGDVSTYRGIDGTFTSNTLLDNGYGDVGSIAVYYNNTKGGELTFTSAIGDTVNSNGLKISDNNWYPISQPNFHQAFDANVEAAPVLEGWNRYQITYVDGQGANQASNEVYLLRDNLISTASFISGALTEGNSGTLAYSSGIPHYQSGAVLTMSGATLNDLSGFTYSSEDPLVISSTNGNLFDTPVTLGYAALSINVPLSINTTGVSTSCDITLNAANSHTTDTLRFIARNVNGSSLPNDITALNILYMNGTTTGINESARVDLGVGDTMVDAPDIVGGLPSTPTPFPSAQSLANTSYTSEAVIVGGVLKHDLTDYSSGYLPQGTNYSSKKADSQYVDFVFNAPALSEIGINIDGTYSGLWIGLEGYSDDDSQLVCPNSINGTWWDGFVGYNGSGFPGRDGASAGCAKGAVPTGTSGSYVMTFGSASTSKNSDGSNASTPKNIFVRFMLAANESITSLTIG